MIWPVDVMIHLDIISFICQTDIMELALNQGGPATERQLAIIDKNKDLYLRAVRQYGTERLVKLGMRYCVKGRWEIIKVNLWSNGLVVKALDSKSRDPVFKTTGWLQGQLSLSSFQG